MLAFEKLQSIFNGWKNWAWENQEAEKVAKERAAVCVKCPESLVGVIDSLIGDRIEEIEGVVCDICDCPLSGKLRSLTEKCPLSKW